MILQCWSKGNKLIDTECSIVHTKIWMVNENNLKNSKSQTCKLSRDLSHTAFFFFCFSVKDKMCSNFKFYIFTLSLSTFCTLFFKACSSNWRIWPSWSHRAKKWSWKALEFSCFKNNLKKLGQNSQKVMGIWNSLQGYKHQQNQTEKTV